MKKSKENLEELLDYYTVDFFVEKYNSLIPKDSKTRLEVDKHSDSAFFVVHHNSHKAFSVCKKTGRVFINTESIDSNLKKHASTINRMVSNLLKRKSKKIVHWVFLL